jgi:hypothetical protein
MPAKVVININSLRIMLKKMRHMPQLNKAYDVVFGFRLEDCVVDLMQLVTVHVFYGMGLNP